MKQLFSVLSIRNFYNYYGREGDKICFLAFLMLFEMKSKLESNFQSDLVDALETMFPGALIYKNETKQGLPDLTVLYKDHWALLECKASEKSTHRPNQDYYIDRANEMSFARFIYPENKEEVLHDLQQAFRAGRQTRNSKSK